MRTRSRSRFRRPLFAVSALVAAGCATETSTICNSDVRDCEIDQAEREVVYGTDDRKEYSDPTVNAAHRKLGDSVGLLFVDSEDGADAALCDSDTCVLRQSSITQTSGSGKTTIGLCTGEKFGPTSTLPYGQARARMGRCTAFLVAPHLMATAGHCFAPDEGSPWTTPAEACEQFKVAFDYHAEADGQAPVLVDSAHVYACSRVWTSVYDETVDHEPVKDGRDYALFELDRPVTDRKPVPIRRNNAVALGAPLLLAGHPSALPLKLSAAGKVESLKPINVFTASIDAFGGNSGSPVFNRSTGLVEGILAGGNADYLVSSDAAHPSGCLRAKTCLETGCTGSTYPHEWVSHTAPVASLVPDQSPRAFTASTPTIDAAYARVASGDFDGDGVGDVLFHGADGNADAIWYGTFDKTATNRVVTVPDGYGIPLVGDFDADGRSDIFWYRSGTGQDRIWWGQPSRPSFGATANSTPIREDGVGYSPIVGDFDGDRDADILWYGRGTTAPAEKIWWSNGNRNGQPKSGATATFTSQAKSVSATKFFPVAGDFDADGKDDIFWFEPGNVNASFWRHTTGQTFTTTKLTLPTTLGTSHRALSGDFDGNGAVDLLFYAPGTTTDYAFWFRIDQKGKYAAKTVSLHGSYRPAVGDFNGDTAADVLFYGNGTNADYRLWGRLL